MLAEDSTLAPGKIVTPAGSQATFLALVVGRGLQSEPTDRTELARILSKIGANLRHCPAESARLERRFDIAYETLLQCCLATFRTHGLRPNSKGGHHVLAKQTLPTTIGCAKEKIHLLEEFRKQRAAGLYDGSFSPSEVELPALATAASKVRDALIGWLKANRPELLP